MDLKEDNYSQTNEIKKEVPMTSTDVTKFKRKKKTRTSTQIFKCLFCATSFSKENKFITHLDFHNNPFACEICKKRFSTEEYLQHHKETHIDECGVKCDLCDNVFLMQDELVKHMQCHNKSYKCKTCGKCFLYENQLKSHFTRHVRKPYKCKYCNKLFKKEYMLNNHIKSHSDKIEKRIKNIYPCTICLKYFLSTSSLEAHLLIHTDGKKLYSCDKCEMTFLTDDISIEHTCNSSMQQLTENVASNETVKCQFCLEFFLNPNELDEHFCSHKRYKCEICGRSFPLNKSLEYHMRTHDDNSPYNCNICFKQYTTYVLLQDHIRKVHNRRTPNCHNLMLNSHTPKKCTEERLLKCDKCNIDFVNEEMLNIYMQSHTEPQCSYVYHKKDFTCDYCKEVFTCKEDLSNHHYDFHSLENAIEIKEETIEKSD